jgi:hypothetical protein
MMSRTWGAAGPGTRRFPGLVWGWIGCNRGRVRKRMGPALAGVPPCPLGSRRRASPRSRVTAIGITHLPLFATQKDAPLVRLGCGFAVVWQVAAK